MANRLTLKNYSKETNLFHKRVIIAAAIVVLLSITLVVRLAYLQIIEKDTYTTLSIQNQQALIPVEPNRGLIYDRNGILLAENIPSFSLDIIPDRVHDIDDTITELQKLFEIDEDTVDNFFKSLPQHRRYEPVSLKLKLTEEEVARFSVNQHRFPGVQINARLLRHYPQGPESVSALGYVARINEQELQHIDSANYSASNYIGKLGIERFYEEDLHGIVGYKQVEINAAGQIVRVLKDYPPIPGDNIYLSLDSELQHVAHEAFQGERGSAVAIKPSTGEVLVLLSYPSYDPNLFVGGISKKDYQALREDKDRPLYNRAIRGVYPFGSTIKPFYAIEGLDEGFIDPDYKLHCNGYFYLPGVNKGWRDWNHKKGGHGRVGVHGAIMCSCDIFFYTLATRMGITRMDKVLHQFGFGELTHIDVTDELPGLVPTPKWKKKTQNQGWYPGDTVISGIGQGFLLTTPMQLANAVATLSVRGIRHQPQLLSKIQKPNGEVIEQAPILQAPIELKNPDNWNVVIDAMHDVVASPRGTAYVKFGQTNLYTTAAKTGTAQVYRPPALADKKDEEVAVQYRDNSLFIAFAPVEDPQIAIAVIAENSHAAAKVARAVFDAYFTRLQQNANI